MKVIVAAFSKCGTKTMAQALRDLDMVVYDAMENYEYLSSDWLKVFKTGGTVEDFKRMYAEVDACTDIPSCYFWEEIHEAFPDAKIVFLQRENEEIWWESMKKQMLSANGFFLNLLKLFSPTFAHLNWYSVKMNKVIFGYNTHSYFGDLKINEQLIRMTYRQHNSYVLEKAPKDKLLVMDIKQGWGPLCDFLGVPVPDKPWPHKNKNAALLKDLYNTNPVFIRVQREFKIFTTLFGITVAYAGYKAVKNRSAIVGVCSSLTSSLFEFLANGKSFVLKD